MAQKITAQMAHEWGAVNEVLPKDRVLGRAWEIARNAERIPGLSRDPRPR